jgi:hypothetical protein
LKSAVLLARPDNFLEVRVSRLDLTPTLHGLCAGYEQGRWRSKEFAQHLMEWLPEFALNYSDAQAITSGNAVRLLRDAALRVYQSDKFEQRGEFGELLLHAALRQVFDTIPAISKIYYKDSANNTVKGFDAVHVVATKNSLELWLGEAKFYDNFSRAVASVIKELALHTGNDFLRKEFALIVNKIDPAWPHADRLKKLLSPNTSLDQVFDTLCVPVLLTYNSATLASHVKVTSEFRAAFSKELETHYTSFAAQSLPKNARIHLILVPLHTKKELVTALDTELKRWQGR